MTTMRHAYHLADADNWPLIQRDGLLSADELITRAGGIDEFRAYRSRNVQLPSGVWIRDQRPMPPSALARCLDPGLDPDAWYALVNSKVFFWLSPERLERHRAACRQRPQITVVIDLAALLARYRDRASVTPFNVGNAKRNAAPRGHRTFVPIDDWHATRWQTEARHGHEVRPRSYPPAELAIDHAVPDIMDFVIASGVTLAPVISNTV